MAAESLRFWDPLLHYALSSDARNACLNEILTVCPELRPLLAEVREFCDARAHGLRDGYSVSLRCLSLSAVVTSQDVVYRFVQFLSQ